MLDSTSRIDPVAGVGAHPLPDHAAHRQSAPVEGLGAGGVGDRERVAAEHVHGVGALGRAGLAVAAAVVADQAELPCDQAGAWSSHMCRSVPSELHSISAGALGRAFDLGS